MVTSSGNYSLLLRLKMSLLFLIKLTVECKGIPQEQFIHTWLKDAEESLKAKEDGRILQLWKVNETALNINRPMQNFKRNQPHFFTLSMGTSRNFKGHAQISRSLHILS